MKLTCRSAARLTVLVLCLIWIFQWEGNAQSSHVDLYRNIWVDSIGFGHGQTLLYTFANLNEPDPRKREFEPVRIEVKLLAADGSVIAQSAAPAVGLGRSQSFAFNRDEISLAGEAGTGRLQVRPDVTVQIRRRNLLTTLSYDRFFDDAVEIIDNVSGRTTSTYERLNKGLGNGYLVGIVPGQTLRVTVFNPSDPELGGRQPQPQTARVWVIQADGGYIAESAEVNVPAGDFHSFDFNRTSLNAPGEQVTGRLQVRVFVEGTFTLTFSGQTVSGPPPASWELVDNITGRTEVTSSQPDFFLKNTNTW